MPQEGGGHGGASWHPSAFGFIKKYIGRLKGIQPTEKGNAVFECTINRAALGKITVTSKHLFIQLLSLLTEPLFISD